MASAPIDTMLRQLRDWHTHQVLGDVSDSQLLQRFTARREEAAFAALVRRHGPMVLGVSRRILHAVQDAEDVFQATFLLLARKAASIRKQSSLGSWLHGVAHRLALRTKEQRTRRRAYEKRAADMRDTATTATQWPDVQAVLDQALDALPEKYRAALILCYLEGLTHADAAQHLGCQLATLRSHVARGRKLLRERLIKQGLTLSTAGIVSLLLANTTSASAPTALTKTTVKIALAFAAGHKAAAICSDSVAGLVEGGLRTMFFSKVKIASVVFVAAAILSAACGLTQSAATSDEPAAKPRQEPAPANPQAADDAKDNKDSVEVTGRVADPDGKPVQGATIYYMRHHVLRVRAYFGEPLSPPPPGQATSGADGSFHFRIASKGFEGAEEEKHWFHITLTAVAAGYGPGWKAVDKPEALKDVTLKLVKDDVPIEGRFVGLEGKPIAAATVRVLGFGANGSEDLKPWLDALQKQKELVFGGHHPGNALDPAVI